MDNTAFTTLSTAVSTNLTAAIGAGVALLGLILATRAGIRFFRLFTH